MDGTVLIADDDRTIRTVLTQALTRAGCKVHATGSLGTLKRWVEEGRGDLVISDVVMPDGNGLEALPQIARARPDLPVIVISAQNTIMTAIQAAEAEAFDYLPKPFDLPDLMKRANEGLKRKRMRTGPTAGAADDAVQLAAPEPGLPLVGHSAAMQALYRLVARVMNTGLPVMITGASGTGKSLIARALHDFSDRSGQPFVIADLECFSREGGLEDLCQRAGGGTLVFDEVADLAPDAQARLTRLLDQIADGGPRVIATSQRDIAADLGPDTFREDLYYRLSTVHIPVPALRDRVEDIPDLAAHFLESGVAEGLARRVLSDGALEILRAHPWPGNIRQLENTIRRLLVTGINPEISRDEVQAVLQGAPVGDVTGARVTMTDSLSSAVEQHLRRAFDLEGGGLPPAGLYERVLHQVERPLLEIALDATGGNQARCADLLGINRNTLRKKLTTLGIEVTRRRKLM